ncbi:hypothetical protein ACLOJK_028077 [Asimina triloba]
MVRRRVTDGKELAVSIPSYFKCPISLEVMKSPVSLCTGVTYDRANIQKWLDSGHTTCPATMQPLRSTAFTPNLTLLTLIRSWQHQQASVSQPSSSSSAAGSRDVQFLLRQLAQPRSALPSAAAVDSLSKIAAFIQQDPAKSRQLLAGVDCVKTVAGVLRDRKEELGVAEAALRLLSLVLTEEIAGKVAEEIDWNRLLPVLRRGSVEARINTARVLELTLGACRSDDCPVAETEGVLQELIRLTSSKNDGKAIEAGLSCLIAVSARRKVRSVMVRLGAVRALGGLLAESESVAVAEQALRLLETLSGCAEGRAAICEDSACVPAIVRRMLKVSAAATERAVVLLWSVCHVFRDRKAQEAVASSNGVTKILLLMQSNCSPAARQMCGDLVKIFKVNSKSCLASYDTKTTHIMPY